MQDAGAGVHALRGDQHLLRDRGGEDLAGARGVQHAEADVAGVERLVPGAAAGDEAHLAGPRRVGAKDDAMLVIHPDQVAMGSLETDQ